MDRHRSPEVSRIFECVQDDRSIHHAVLTRNYLLVRQLVHKCTNDINGGTPLGGWTPLHIACVTNNVEICRLLIDDGGADVNRFGVGDSSSAPIQIAAWWGYTDIVMLLLHRGANVNTRTPSTKAKTALHTACLHGHVEVVKALLHHGANPNLLAQYRQTPLHDCCQSRLNAERALDIARLLLEDQNAPVSSPLLHRQDFVGRSALHYASERGHYPLVRFLVEKGANILLKDRFGRTSVHYAASYGSSVPSSNCYDKVEILKLFISINPFCLSERCSKGNLPLHWARNPHVARALVENVFFTGNGWLAHDTFFTINKQSETALRRQALSLQRIKKCCNRDEKHGEEVQHLKETVAYFQSFSQKPLTVQRSGLSNRFFNNKVSLNAELNDFQMALAKRVFTTLTNGLQHIPDEIFNEILGFLSPADVMRREKRLILVRPDKRIKL